jgi:methionyl aminopeptidase
MGAIKWGFLIPAISFTIVADLGSRYINQDQDGWTIRTKDRQPSAHYELAVAIGKREARMLSTFRYIEDVLNNK